MTARYPLPFNKLRSIFKDRFKQDASLADYTTAHIGGNADGLLIVNKRQELIEGLNLFWNENIPFQVLGNGSNVLVSDSGIRGIVIINQCNEMRLDPNNNPPNIWAESGAKLSAVAQKAALSGLSGLEWAAIIPGTLGGAVYGNAGAHGACIESMLEMVEILQPVNRLERWDANQMAYSYRSSILKRENLQAVVLSAQLNLSLSSQEEVNKKTEAIIKHRRKIQPAGASMGSMFKNPPGDYAARLIEAAGLKGRRIGNVEVSTVHANFFVHHQGACAADVLKLINLVQREVMDKFNITLELEIEIIGDCQEINTLKV